MEEEISYLLDKFSESSQKKVYFHDKFEALRKSLKDLPSSCSPKQRKLIREKLHRLINLSTECQMTAKSPADLLSLLPIRRELSRIGKEIAAIKDTSSAAAAGNRQAQPSPATAEEEQYPGQSSRIDLTEIHGLQTEETLLVSMLLRKRDRNRDVGFKTIGIVGAQGVGKTTLCRVVMNRAEIKNHFLPRIWVAMSGLPADAEEPKKVEIVKRMLNCLGVEEETMDSIHKSHGLKGLTYALHLQLVGKRYLIVLEDAWDRNVWYYDLGSSLAPGEEWNGRLAYGLPKGDGGIVVVTSRDEKLAEQMVGKENLHRLLPLLDPEDCWKIFKAEAEKGGKTLPRTNLEDLEKEIKQKCNGLPLAARILGQILNEMQQAPENSQASEIETANGQQ